MSKKASGKANGSWKDYEKLIQRIFQGLMQCEGVKNLDVLHNVELPGKTTDQNGKPGKHQIDVYWKFEIGGVIYQAVVQAKEWGSRVTKEKVLTFKAVLDDLPGQPHGIMVTKIGYQKGAESFARAHGIDLYILKNPIGNATITTNPVGAMMSTLIDDVQLIFEPEWAAKNEGRVKELLSQIKPEEAYIYSIDGEKIKPLSSVFDNIRNMAALNRTEDPILNAFDAPALIKSEGAEPVVVLGISAKCIITKKSEFAYHFDLSMFPFMFEKITGEKKYVVDHEMKSYSLNPDQKTFCDFCSVPIPDDASNLFYTERILAVTRRCCATLV